MIDVLNGPFGRASSLSDPDSGEHYRIVYADAVVGMRHMSRMSAYADVDLLRDQIAAAFPMPFPIGVVRVLPK